MRSVRSLRLMCAALTSTALLGGCYHATVNTGQAPNGVVIQENWAHSFIGGLVPPSTVNAASQCPNGVATVSTQLSFLNMLANAVTFGIYSPMTIRVECAGATALLEAENTVTLAASGTAERAMNEALRRAKASGEPVHVRFTE